MKNYEKFYQPGFIESYVRGACSAEEREVMQKLLQSNADLRAEVAFQKDLLTAIAASRKADLKKMLQQTPVPAHQPFYQKPAVQIAAVSVGAIALIATIWGLYRYTQETDTKNTTQPKKVEYVQDMKISTRKNKEVVEIKKLPDNKPSETLKVKPNKKEVTPKKPTSEDKNPIFIKEIHYQYDGASVLQLFGDFKYELLEKVDVGAGEKTYIYIQNQFFELIPTAFDEVRNLKESLVTDKEQIKLLTEKLSKK